MRSKPPFAFPINLHLPLILKLFPISSFYFQLFNFFIGFPSRFNPKCFLESVAGEDYRMSVVERGLTRFVRVTSFLKQDRDSLKFGGTSPSYHAYHASGTLQLHMLRNSINHRFNDVCGPHTR